MPRAPLNHVVIVDGTLANLEPDKQTNAGQTFKLLEEVAIADSLSLTYIRGLQWRGWGSLIDLIAGTGINRQIRDAYAAIANDYQAGDRIFLLGFSRGAYAVRSLAGVIDQIGLVTPRPSIMRATRQAFRHYRNGSDSVAARRFCDRFCHRDVHIEMIGVWDTVKALGIQYPLLWRLAPQPTDFHDHALGKSVRHGFQALAINETRRAFEPVLWESTQHWEGHLEQVWFRGAHADVGGHIGSFGAARPLSNIPLVWMLEHAERCGLQLPEGWSDRFRTDQNAPAYGDNRKFARLFRFRRKRTMLADPSESIHPTAL